MERDQLHVFFFPFMSQGHVIPTVEIAKLFASRGSKATVITTSHFAQIYSKTLLEEQSRVSGGEIKFLTVRIPCSEVGLHEGFESFHMASSHEMHLKFYKAIGMLGEQLDNLLRRHHPDCLVADTFFPWATDVASKSGIPTLIFHATGYFSLCASLCAFLYKPYKNVSSDSEPFIIPTLPNRIEFTRDKLPADFLREDVETEFAKLYKATREVELRSFGVLVNSFYELEPDYVDHYRKVLGIKAWQIGPHCLHIKKRENKALTGVNENECLKWLDSREPDSVVYVCFGSMVNFTDPQLMEIAMGLEASGKQFIWVVKKEKEQDGVREEWLPEGFEKRMEGKGLIIRGWAPQVLILEHQAIGGFLSHSGWNSTLEAVCAGKPMATWPVFADHFYNEKLVTQLLGIGASVGSQKWASIVGDSTVNREAIEKTVRKVMEGEEAEKMRSRARALAGMARRAVEEGGSSYSDLNALLEELRLHRATIHVNSK